MTRRFTLFAILAAACLLFTSCGGLFTSSATQAPSEKTTSIRIPLPSRSLRTAMDPTKPNTPLELCDSYEFILKSTTSQYTATANANDAYAEFPAIPYDTYTMTAKAYGKLSDGKTTVIANFSQSNIIINKASVTIAVKFTLTDAARSYLYGYTGTPVTNADGSITQPIYADEDGKTVLSEKTVSSDGRTETEVSYAVDLETGENIVDAEGNPLVSKTIEKETLSEGNDKITTTEFSLTEEDCTKRITIEENNTTTVMKYNDNNAAVDNPVSKEVTEKNPAENKTTVTTYDNSDMENPASVTEISTTVTKTTTYDPDNKDSGNVATIVIEITAGNDKGQKTIQKHDTDAAGNPMTEETVISATGTAVVSTDYATVDGKSHPQKETYYAAGYDYENPASNANERLINKEVEYTVENGAINGKTETTYGYDDKLTTAKDFDGSTSIIPVAKTVEKVYTTSNGEDVLSSTKTTDYEYTDGKKSKVVVTETQAGSTTPDKTTTTEYNLTQGNNGCAMRITIAEGNTTTVSRYAANAVDPEEGWKEMDVITQSEEVKTTHSYTNGDLQHPVQKVEEESTKTTTTEYVANSDKTNKVTEIITTGINAGQKTETEYNTTGTKSVPAVETVTSPDNHKTISTFDYSTSNTQKKTTYQTDWVPGAGGSAVTGDPDDYHISSILEETSTGTVQTDYAYVSGITAKNVNGEPLIPYSQVIVEKKDSTGTITSTQVTDYTYEASGMPTSIITTDPANPGVEIAFQKYTYKDNGTPNTYAKKEDGKNAEYFAYRPIGLKVYSDSAMTTSVIFASTGTTFFECPCTKDDFSDPDASKIPSTTIAQYLEDHYVLVGNTIQKENVSGYDKDDLNFITTSQINDAHDAKFNYIFKVNFTGFLTTSCFTKGTIVSEGTGEDQCFYLKCYLHNDKNSCSNFWGSNHNFSSAKYIITTTNYGCATDTDYPGNNQGI